MEKESDRNTVWQSLETLSDREKDIMIMRFGLKGNPERTQKEVADIIGISQSFALIPGFSRSGTTILTGRLLGLSKEAVTKFTFLLSVPIICGAAILKIFELSITKEVSIGIFTSFVVGVFAIKFLLNYIKKHDFSVFAIYRVVFAIIILAKYFFF